MSGFPYPGAAVVTGAGSGIGLATAHVLAARGMDLALVDVSPERLEAARVALTTNERRVTVHAMDVADRASVRALPGRVADDHPVVSVLMNNAGVALGGDFEEVSEDDFDWLFEINFHAVVRLTRGFLPLLRAAPRARIVNVSSLFGLIAPAGQVPYAASKFAVRGFSEALRHELEAQGASVGVTTVHPGGVATNISRDARIGADWSEAELARRAATAERLLSLPPEEAARRIVDAMARGRGRVLVGRDAKMAAIVQRLLPASYDRVLARRMREAE